jgi:hypothetical protein
MDHTTVFAQDGFKTDLGYERSREGQNKKKLKYDQKGVFTK